MNPKNIENKVNRKRYRVAYTITLVSLTLILFIMSVIGLLYMEVTRLTRAFKENASLTIVMKESATSKDIQKYKNELDQKLFVKTTQFVDKDLAAKYFAEDIGTDFVEVLGFNPLPSVINLTLKAEYVDKDSIVMIKDVITEMPVVSDIEGDVDMMGNMNAILRVVNYVFVGLSILLIIISFALINNTIRLSIYSKRFLIRTMLLVGAKRSFVRRPYILQGLIQGIICSLLAMGVLVLCLYYGSYYLPQLKEMLDVILLAKVFTFVLGIGVVTSIVSSYFAISKYIRMNTDSLYRV